MAVCKFFQSGTCIKGNNCNFEHVKQGQTAAVAPKYNETSLRNNLTEERPEWKLSVFGPAKEEPNLIVGTDISCEEDRYQYYYSMITTGSDTQYISNYEQSFNQVETQINAVINNPAGAIQHYEKEKSSKTGVFGSTAANTPFAPFTGGGFGSTPAFGSTTAFGSSTPNAFGTSSFGSTTTPAFGSTGAFGGTGNQGAFGSKPAFGALNTSGTPAFGSTSSMGAGAPAFGSTSTVGGFGQPSTLGGGSAFGKPSAFGGGSAFGQPSALGGSTAFGQPSALGSTGSAFGKPSALGGGGGSVFGQANNVGSTAFGQPSTNNNTAIPAFGSTSTVGANTTEFGSTKPSGGNAFSKPTASVDTNGDPNLEAFASNAFKYRHIPEIEPPIELR